MRNALPAVLLGLAIGCMGQEAPPTAPQQAKGDPTSRPSTVEGSTSFFRSVVAETTTHPKKQVPEGRLSEETRKLAEDVLRSLLEARERQKAVGLEAPEHLWLIDLEIYQRVLDSRSDNWALWGPVR